jgi:CDP-diacylglycerol--glycerol-3-phosphate 3-phosphatidyltransferase
MRRASKSEVLNLPNTLTGIRLACIPLVLICLSFSGRLGSLLAAIFFSLAFITDILDGFYARKYGAVTVLGKFLDPLADKILVAGTMIMLISLGRIPAWMVVVIIAREMAVTGLRGVAVNEGIVIQASAWGKNKTIFQAVALAFLCLHYEYWRINTQAVGMLLFWVAVVLTLWSGWDYFRQFYRVFSPRKRRK